MKHLYWLLLLGALAPLSALDIGEAVRTPKDNTAVTVAEARVFYATWNEGLSYNGGTVTVVSDDSAHSVVGNLFFLDGPLDPGSNLPTSGTMIVALDEVLKDGEAYHLEWPANLISAGSGPLAASTDHDWNILVSGTAGGAGGPVPAVIDTPDASASSDATIDHSVLLFYDPDVAGATPADRTTGMVLTIETLPSRGNLSLSGSTVTAGQAITVTDVAAGNLVYSTSETDAGTDAFAYRWTDAAGSTTPILWFEVGLAGGGGGAPSFDVADFDIPFTEAVRPLYDPDTNDADIAWVALYNVGFDVTHSGSMGPITVTVAYDDADRLFVDWDQLRFTGTLGGDVTMDATSNGVDGKALKLFLASGKQATALQNLLGNLQFRHTSAQFTADTTRNITVTVTEGGSSGGTVSTTHAVNITANDSAPVLDKVLDGTRNYIAPFGFTVDESGLELTVVAHDYEQQSVTVGLDPAGVIPINGIFDVVSISSVALDSSVDVPGPHSLNRIVIRYEPTNANVSDTLSLELTDGGSASTFSIVVNIDPFDTGRPQLVGDPPLVTTATAGVHTVGLSMTHLGSIIEANCRFQGSPPVGITADVAAGAGTVTFTWPASGEHETPINFDYVLLDGTEAATIPVSTVAIDPDTVAKPEGTLDPTSN